MKRREFLKLGIGSLLGSAALTGCAYWPRDGFFNECQNGHLPKDLAGEALIKQAWAGIDASQVWDCHTHLVGTGDSDSGIYVTEEMKSLWHPIQFAQFKFYLDGACVGAEGDGSVDENYVKRLVEIQQGMATGAKAMLLGFAHFHDEQGKADKIMSTFHTPNAYAKRIAQQHPDLFEWIASIHPYAADAVEQLEQASADGARAIKWLPSAMGISPAASRCDAFYQALARLNMPLLTHAGTEHAVRSHGEVTGSPLSFRRALDQGVRVIFAHCASLGESVDTDQGPNGPTVSNLSLFARLIEDPKYKDQVWGDISALTQLNRNIEVIKTVIRNQHWHSHLINGSDYPLPGILPVFAPQWFVEEGMLPQAAVPVLSQIRQHNPLLFDFVLKRSLTVDGHALQPTVFESRRAFV